MKRILFTSLLLVLLLSACGRTTRLNANVNLLPFIGEENKFAEAFIKTGLELEIPDPEGFAGDELGLPTQVLENLDALELDFSTLLTLSSATSGIDTTFELFISDSAPVFEAIPISVETALSPDAEQTLDFKLTLNDEENSELFELVKTGDFRLGIRITTSAPEGDTTGKISSELSKLELIFTADLSMALSF